MEEKCRKGVKNLRTQNWLSKIFGNSFSCPDAVLESYNTPLDWTAISKCLTAHFVDKRDLKTLEYQLYALNQGCDSIVDYYQAV